MKLDNKEIQKRIELIKYELTDLQGQLKDKEEIIFLKNKWYKDECDEHLIFITKERKYNQGGICGYGVARRGIWNDAIGVCGMTGREATKEEVEKALIKEAKRRGFEEGVSFINLSKVYPGTIEKVQGLFSLQSTGLGTHCGFVFSEGAWAEIVKEKEMTQKEIEEELGYKIKIV